MTKPGQGIRGSVPVSIIRATLFLAAISRVSIVLAQSAGVFTPTGSMTAQRAGHTATLLPNGKVLIAGGYQNVLPDSILASAELYDPSTGMFIATANMSVPRVRHTATLLPDGRVLIAGGATDLSAEIFDPSRGTFAVTGAMVVRPYSWLQAATLLHDGRVLIAGDPTAELYDPVTGTFAATSPYAASAPTYMETAVLLADGRVLLTGGGDVAGWTELYDPATGKFSLAGRMSTWSDVNTATVLTSGKVLFVGNVENDGFPADAEIFDPPSGLFTRLASAAANHEYAAAASPRWNGAGHRWPTPRREWRGCLRVL
jgi:WD40 repeat protein